MRHDSTIAVTLGILLGCGPAVIGPVAPRPSLGGPGTDLESRVYLWMEDRCLADNGPPCSWSDELAPAATALAESLVRDGSGAFESESFVRAELARAGIGHPNTMAAALFYSGDAPSDRDLATFVSGVRWRWPVREFAVAEAGPPAATDGPSAVVVVGMERLVEMDPPPRWLPQAAAVTFGGALLTGWSNATAFVSGPSGAVREVAVRAGADGAFRGALPIGPEPGRYVFELLAERGGGGPAVVYLLPIELSATPPEPPAPPGETGGAETTEPALATEAMVSLVNAFRSENGLAALGRSADLDAAASSHAADMAANGFFGHVSPTRGDLTERLRSARIPAPRAAENLALGPSAEAAFRNLLDSPAHRANFLDPDLSLLGVSCARSGDSLVFAIVMAAGW